jgi:predicted CopG family antitoxin
MRESTYHKLAQLGTLEDSFDAVISRLIEKAASSQSSFEGSIGQKAESDRRNPEVKTVK